jgi:DNA-binding Lrp family transcriptional regulator
MSTEPKLYLGKIIPETANVADLDLDKIPDKDKFYLPLGGSLAICGVPRSGKTVLGKIIIEECILHRIPVLLIDHKGDLAQVCQTPLGMGSYFGLSEKDIQDWQKLQRDFGIVENEKSYNEMMNVRFFDHFSQPSPEDILSFLTCTGSQQIPLTIVMPQSGTNEDIRAMERWLSAVISSLPELSSPQRAHKRLLVIDEGKKYFAKRVLRDKLIQLLREGSKAGVCVLICTQYIQDLNGVEKDLRSACEFFGKRKFYVRHRRTEFGALGPIIEEGNAVAARGLLSADTKSMGPEDLIRMRDYWDSRNHPWDPFLIDASGMSDAIDQLDMTILNYLNCKPVSIDWKSADALLGNNGIELTEIEKIFRNADFRNLGHFHAVLDYKKLGYPILAFFVCKGKDIPNVKDEYEKGIQEVKNRKSTLGLFKISSSEYLGVSILAKFRFKDMDDYYKFVSTTMLRISQRGKSERERSNILLENLLSKIKQKLGQVNCEPPAKSCKVLQKLQNLSPEEFGETLIPEEQLVSGCITTKTFSELHTCDGEDGIVKTLSTREHKVLEAIREIKFSDQKVDFDVDSMRKDMLQLGLIKNNVTKEDLSARITDMREKGIVEGAYLGMPWYLLKYKTCFVIGQLNFDTLDSDAEKISNIKRVQEVHTIVGTYDVIIKVRYRNPPELDEVIRNLEGLLVKGSCVKLQVEEQLKSKSRMSGSF